MNNPNHLPEQYVCEVHNNTLTLIRTKRWTSLVEKISTKPNSSLNSEIDKDKDKDRWQRQSQWQRQRQDKDMWKRQRHMTKTKACDKDKDMWQRQRHVTKTKTHDGESRLTLLDPRQGRRHSTWWSPRSSLSGSGLEETTVSFGTLLSSQLWYLTDIHLATVWLSNLGLLIHVNYVVEGKLKAHLECNRFGCFLPLAALIWPLFYIGAFIWPLFIWLLLGNLQTCLVFSLKNWFSLRNLVVIPWSGIALKMSQLCFVPWLEILICWKFASYMDDVVWVGSWQNVVALTIKDEKSFDATQLFTLYTPEIEPDNMRTRKIPEDTCPPVAWRAEKESH